MVVVHVEAGVPAGMKLGVGCGRRDVRLEPGQGAVAIVVYAVHERVVKFWHVGSWASVVLRRVGKMRELAAGGG